MVEKEIGKNNKILGNQTTEVEPVEELSADEKENKEMEKLKKLENKNQIEGNLNKKDKEEFLNLTQNILKQEEK